MNIIVFLILTIVILYPDIKSDALENKQATGFAPSLAGPSSTSKTSERCSSPKNIEEEKSEVGRRNTARAILADWASRTTLHGLGCISYFILCYLIILDLICTCLI